MRSSSGRSPVFWDSGDSGTAPNTSQRWRPAEWENDRFAVNRKPVCGLASTANCSLLCRLDPSFLQGGSDAQKGPRRQDDIGCLSEWATMHSLPADVQIRCAFGPVSKPSVTRTFSLLNSNSFMESLRQNICSQMQVLWPLNLSHTVTPSSQNTNSVIIQSSVGKTFTHVSRICCPNTRLSFFCRGKCLVYFCPWRKTYVAQGPLGMRGIPYMWRTCDSHWTDWMFRWDGSNSTSNMVGISLL
jgi:hypothetical protein